MNILEYIEKHYPISERVRELIQDPYKRIAEMDDLPYDKIGPDADGVVTKLVEISDGVFIPVLDILGYTEKDIEASKDEDLKLAWHAYMENVDIQDMNLVDLMRCANDYKGIQRDRRKKLDVLSLQEV